MSRGRRVLTLVKGRHRFVFTCAEGRESELLSALLSLADTPDSGLDWLDAAALSMQIGRPGPAEVAPDMPAAIGQWL